MWESKKRYLILAALTLVLAAPCLADETASEPITTDDARCQAVAGSGEPLPGQPCHDGAGSANGEALAEAPPALYDAQILMPSPCQGAAAGSEIPASAAVCNCKVGQPCIRPCASSNETPRCLDITCLSPSSQYDGVCVCV